MAETGEKIREFKQTISPEDVIRAIETGDHCDLTWLFDEYPIFTVRKAILKCWLERHIGVFDWQADWMEARIRDFSKEIGRINCDFWKELLECYIFGTKGLLANRALDFAVEIAKTEHFRIYRSDILKLITGKLVRSPEIYYYAQHTGTKDLRLFLESFLVRAYQPKFTIYDCAMVDIKRVVRCAISVEDWRFLPLIELVLYKYYNQARPERYDFDKEVEILENITFLREAVRYMREKTEEIKNT